MEDYKINFDIDSKIAWNRHRIRELTDMYKKIENYYLLFLAFLGFIGVYYFEFIVQIIYNFNHWFLLTTTFTTFGVFWALYFMVRIIFTKEWRNDNDPKEIYKDLFDEWTIYLKEKTPDYSPQYLDQKVRDAYNKGLEIDIDYNFKIYSQKKTYVKNVLRVILLTLIVYSINIIHFKLL